MPTDVEKANEARWLRLAPIKIGLLGSEWKSFRREVEMAFDEGIERGLLDRRYDIIWEEHAGLPQDTAQVGIDAYNRLCDAGCLVVLGANYTDAAIPLVEETEKRKIPLISMCGTDQFHGEYCFRVGNGDVGDEPALIASWLRNEGHRSIAVIAPASPIGEEYFFFLRQECRRQGILIRSVETITTAVRDLPDVLSRARAANADTLTALVTERRKEPGDDVVTGLIKATLAMPGEEPRPLTDEEITATCRLVILAGGGTTWRQLGILIWGLLTNYEQWEACRDDRSLIERAVDESLRWNATDPIFPRLTTRDVEVEGVLIPEGSRVDICLGAANRDPTRWDNPDQFDIFRPKQAHLGFAIGEHQCLGMNVAKQEMIVSLNGLMDRFPNMHLNPDHQPAPQLIGGLEQRGMSSIPVIFA